MERVEATFIKHFANANRAKAMNILRPKAKRERHRITFSTGEKISNLHNLGFSIIVSNFVVLMRKLVSGFSAGCVFSLIVALVAIIRTRNLLEMEGQKEYMNTMFPLYR